MKKQTIIIVVVFLSIIILVIGLLAMYNFGETICYLKVEKSYGTHLEYIVITEKDLEIYPLLRKAIETEEFVEGFCRETNKIYRFFNDTYLFKYEEFLYQIYFSS